MRIVLDIGQISLEQLEKLVQWLKNAPLPINPGELTKQLDVENRYCHPSRIHSPFRCHRRVLLRL